MGWVKYLSLGVVVIALIIAGAKIAINSRRGDGSESVFAIGTPLAGAIIIAVAFTAVGALAEAAIGG
ncbi:hypothetical protein ACWFMI_27055 [Nocardiopsis terrae]